MTLSTGTKLAHYEISSQLGKGGMGEVYKAKDQKLGRDVAIKVLPEEFAKDADRVARFQREAKLLASLNHPNIAAIHGLEESDGTHFLVLELIEGDTLADRLKRGAIPVEESLKLALQIAEALEAAHEKGVIHRDLKPANIKVTPDGKVKVLDFGLAKAFAGDSEDINLSNSPTLSVAATQKGIILGTAAYMSPEQASGETTDKRTDIWAFGVVLFEMLTGRSLFAGENVSQTLARVLEREPDFSALPPNLHFRIRLLLERCLKKESKDRCSGVSDARVEIQQVLADPSGVFVQPVVAAKHRKKLPVGIPWLAATLAIGAIIAGVAVWMLKPAEPKQVMRFDYDLPEDQRLTLLAGSVVDLSADGTKIVYVANYQLYLRDLNELTAKPIQGSDEGPTLPIFSPDGLWVGYNSGLDRQWKRISVSGGAPVTLSEPTPFPSGATWGSDNTILFGLEEGIRRVSANGGASELLIKAEEGENLHGPQALPGGEWVLFTIISEGSNDWDEAQIAAQSLETGERKVLVSGGSDARYVPTGHLVYALGDVLYAISFDVDSLEVMGGAAAIVEGVQRAGVTGSANYAFSDNGMLAHVVGSADVALRRRLVWVDRNGKEEPIEAEPRDYENPRISPDGTRVALDITEDGNEDIWIHDLDRGTTSPLTFNKAFDSLPVWTPDSQRIIFASDREEVQGIYWKAAGGTGNVEQLASYEDRGIWPRSISSDGNTLFFGQFRSGSLDIGMLSMEGERTPKLLLDEEYTEIHPQISPDGRWLAYMSNESGEREIYVRPFPDLDSGGKQQVSTKGGTLPLWSPDGKELFYKGPADEIMVVSVETESTFRLGKPQSLFSAENYQDWDIHPNGKRFLMTKNVEATEDESAQEMSPTINIVLNWFEELKERVPD